MYLSFLVCWFSVCGLCSTFFIWQEKKPLFLCFKVCPLYCPNKKSGKNNRYDDDASSLVYVDKKEANSFKNFTSLDLIDFVVNPPKCDFGDCKRTATTTASPEKKSRQKRHDYDDSSYIYNYGDDLSYYDHHHHHPEPHPHYGIHHPRYYVLKRKTTTTTTVVPPNSDYTYEEVEFNHPAPDYYDSHEHGYPNHGHHRPRYFLRKPKPKSTTTEAPTTTEEPTFICQVCKSKCGTSKGND